MASASSYYTFSPFRSQPRTYRGRGSSSTSARGGVSNISQDGQTGGALDPLTNDWYAGSDAEYFDYIKQFEGSSWYERLKNNPHLVGNNAGFSPDLWQQIMEAVGDSSARDRYYADLLAKRNSYLDGILAEMNEYQLNSPANQAALMAQAGQNADLLGTGGVEAAPQNDNIPEPFKPSEVSGSGNDSFAGLVNFGVSLISTCMGFAESIQSLEAGSIAMAGAEINNYTNGLDFASRLLVNSIPASEVDVDKLNNDPSYVDDLFLNAARKVDYSRFSRRTRKTIGYFLNQLERDPNTGSETYFYKNARAELLNRFTSLQSDTAEKRSHKYYSDDLQQMIQDLGKDYTWYYDEYSQLYNKYLRKRASNDLFVEQYPGMATSRAKLEKAGSSAAQSAATSAYYGAQGAKQDFNVRIPQWEIDKLNNQFMGRLNHRLGKYGVVGGFARLMLPGLRSTLEAVPSTFGKVAGAVITKGKL